MYIHLYTSCIIFLGGLGLKKKKRKKRANKVRVEGKKRRYKHQVE